MAVENSGGDIIDKDPAVNPPDENIGELFAPEIEGVTFLGVTLINEADVVDAADLTGGEYPDLPN